MASVVIANRKKREEREAQKQAYRDEQREFNASLWRRTRVTHLRRWRAVSTDDRFSGSGSGTFSGSGRGGRRSFR